MALGRLCLSCMVFFRLLILENIGLPIKIWISGCSWSSGKSGITRLIINDCCWEVTVPSQQAHSSIFYSLHHARCILTHGFTSLIPVACLTPVDIWVSIGPWIVMMKIMLLMKITIAIITDGYYDPSITMMALHALYYTSKQEDYTMTSVQVRKEAQ